MRFKILFVKVSKTVSFKIGTVQLPTIVYLAGDAGTSPQTQGRAGWTPAATSTSTWARARTRSRTCSRAATSATSCPTRRSWSSTSAAPRHNETIRVTVGGREQVYQGVRNIFAYADGGDDSIIVREGVLADVEFHGGSGNDTLIYEGRGNAKLYGDSGDDYIETGTRRDGPGHARGRRRRRLHRPQRLDAAPRSGAATATTACSAAPAATCSRAGTATTRSTAAAATTRSTPAPATT